MTDEKENIAGMAIISLTIGLLLSIIAAFYSYEIKYADNPQNTIGMTPTDVWNAVIANNSLPATLTTYTPGNLTCLPGQNCTEGIKTTESQQNTGFDPLQALIAISYILNLFITILKLTLFAPLYITTIIVPLISNPFIILPITLFGVLWQIANVWLVVSIFIKK